MLVIVQMTKLRIFKSLVLLVSLYGSETWTLTRALEARLVSCNRSFRRIMCYGGSALCPNDGYTVSPTSDQLQHPTFMGTSLGSQWTILLKTLLSPRQVGRKRPVKRLRKSRLQQIGQTCRDEIGMAREPARRLTMRDPRS